MMKESTFEKKEFKEKNLEKIKDILLTSINRAEREETLENLTKIQKETLATFPEAEKIPEELLAIKELQAERLFIDLHRKKVETLSKKYSLEKPEPNVISTCTLTRRIPLEHLLRSGLEAHFTGVNLHLGSCRSKEGNKQKEIEKINRFKEETEKYVLPILSLHGTNKYVHLEFLKSGEAREKDTNTLKRDFELARIVDPKENVSINFDLFSMPKELHKEKFYDPLTTLQELTQARKKELKSLRLHSDAKCIKEIIRLVGEAIPRDNKRPVYFEIPGLMWYGGPEVTRENLKAIIGAAKKYISRDLQKWGITIDVCHIMGSIPFKKGVEGLKEFKGKIKEILCVLEEFKDHIKEIHISGPSSPYTLAAEKLALREKRDINLVKNLETHSVIDNRLILEIVKRIREMCKDHLLVELSEIGPLAGAMHVEKFGIKFDAYKDYLDKLYLDEIKSQGKMLGYTKE